MNWIYIVIQGFVPIRWLDEYPIVTNFYFKGHEILQNDSNLDVLFFFVNIFEKKF